MKIKYLFLPVVVAVLAMSSCAKVLDTAPDGKISYDDVFADNDKTGAFLNNCYSMIPKCGYRYYFWTNWFVCTSDECFDNDADSDGSGMVPNNMYNGNISAGGTDIGNIGNGALYADAAAQSYWEAYWNAIWNGDQYGCLAMENHYQCRAAARHQGGCLGDQVARDALCGQSVI